jgi:ribosomal protein S12 methylthiotransferase
MNKKIGVISLGCDKNRVDTEYMLGIIKDSGLTITNDINSAEIIIINTCAFLKSARQESIETIMECNELRKSGLEKIIITGCLSEKYIDEIFDDLKEADIFLGIKDYDLLPKAIELAYNGERVNFVGTNKELSARKRIISTPVHYAYLKIADGCDNHCTYCLIPKIRGKYKSEPIEKLIEEAKNLGNITELILVAQDITRYGIDIYKKNSLVKLIKELSALNNIESIRLLYCYPDMIDDDLISDIKNNSKIIKYIDIPLQHSEDRILKLMNRKGTRAGYLELINKLKNEIEGIAIRSTFITGFPTETQEDYNNMLYFLEQAKLFNAGFFKFSREEDTAAYRLKNQVSAKDKEKRLKGLYKKQNEIIKTLLNNYIGKEIETVCDGIDYENNRFYGRAYFSAPDIDTIIYFNAKNAEQGKKYKVYIERENNLNLTGKVRD